MFEKLWGSNAGVVIVLCPRCSLTRPASASPTLLPPSSIVASGCPHSPASATPGHPAPSPAPPAADPRPLPPVHVPLEVVLYPRWGGQRQRILRLSLRSQKTLEAQIWRIYIREAIFKNDNVCTTGIAQQHHQVGERTGVEFARYFRMADNTDTTRRKGVSQD